MTKERDGLSAAEVFERLVGRAEKPAAAELTVSTAGKKVATLKSGPKGRVIVEFEAGALTQEKQGALVKFLEDFLAK